MVESKISSSVIKKYFPQYLTGVGITMIVVQIGVSMGWSSPYTARLTAPDSPLRITTDEASWIASLLNLGRFTGSLVGGFSTSYLGSKRTMLLTLLPMVACWIIMILAQDAWMLYVARFCAGVNIGLTYCAYPLYVGEVARPEIRGALVTLAMVGAPFGVAISSVAGSYLSLKVYSGIFLTPCIVLIALFLWMPESPHHLVKVGSLEKAKESINWYRAGYEVDEEFEEVKKFVSNNNSVSFSDTMKKLYSPPLNRAIIFVNVLFGLQQICGVNSVLFFMEFIFINAGLVIIKPSIAVMIVNTMAVVSAICSVVLIDRCGRRILLNISGLGVTISMIGMGTHFLLIEKGIATFENLQWLIISSMLLFSALFAIGILAVPSTVLSETFPADIKCIVASIVSLTAAVVAFGATKSYQPLVDYYGHPFVLYLYAALTFLIVPLSMFCMIETKGKTLQEIQDILAKRQKVDK